MLRSWIALCLLGACSEPMARALMDGGRPDAVLDSTPDGDVLVDSGLNSGLDGGRDGGLDSGTHSDADSGTDACDSRCDGECVDLARDAFHCGGCDVQCAANELCAGGRCVAEERCEPVLGVRCDEIPLTTLASRYPAIHNQLGAVDVDGSTVVVGMRNGSSDGSGESNNASTFAGEVLVFETDEGSWRQTGWIPSPYGAGQNFGSGLALEANELCIGAPAYYVANIAESETEEALAEAAELRRMTLDRVFADLDTDGDGGIERTEWDARGGDIDFFRSLDADDDERITRDEFNLMRPEEARSARTLSPSPGRVVCYLRTDDSWAEDEVLVGEREHDRFGHQMLRAESTLAVLSAGPNTWSFFRRRGGAWERTPLPVDPVRVSVSQDGERIAYVADGVHVARWTGDAWATEATLPIEDVFGLALDGDTLAVGRARVFGFAGEVDVYRETSAGWTLDEQLRAPNQAPGDAFGYTLRLAGDLLVVLAPGEDELVDDDGTYPHAHPPSLRTLRGDSLNPVGAVYVYRRLGADRTRWRLGTYLKPLRGQISSEFARDHVALAGPYLAVSAPLVGVFPRNPDDELVPLPHGAHERGLDTPLAHHAGEVYVYQVGQ
ncbi:MAG: hypothetical protein AAGE52_36370 [Myxococcota bacterium]